MQIPKLSKNYFSYWFGRLSDIRFVGQLLFVLVVLSISWSGVKSIQTNYDLQKQISQIQQQNNVQRLINRNQNLQNQYYNSNQYLELSARQNFGLAEPGETELIVPRNVALSYTVNTPGQSSADQSNHTSSFQKNWQAWVNFFLHRQPH